MNTDLTAPQPAVTPAIEAKEYPLKYATKILLEGGPSAMRAYVELTPYRRIMGEVMVTPPQPVLDEQGQPVMDEESGMPKYTPPVMGQGVVGEELMPETAAGFKRDVVAVPNILPESVTPESEALVGQTLQAFLMAGGDMKALTMAGVVLLVKSVGAQQGVITQ